MANELTMWEKIKDTDWHHTAETAYVTEGFRIWKGKYRVFSVIYSANEWHLERLSDHKILFGARTAKECKEALDHAKSCGYQDVYTDPWIRY